MTCFKKIIRSCMRQLLNLPLLSLLVLLSALLLPSSSASALEITMPIASKFSFGGLTLDGYGGYQCSGYHGNGLACGNDPGGRHYPVSNLYVTVDTPAKSKAILVSFSYVVRATSSEAYSGFGSGSGMVIIDQAMTHVGDQFHGSVLALMGTDSSGRASGYSTTSYNTTNSFSILINEPAAAEINGSGIGGIGATAENYLGNISWNSTQTQTKLEAVLTNLESIQGDLGTIAWNSTETQKKLEAIIAKIDANSSSNNAILQEQLDEQKKQTDAINKQTEQEKNQYDQEKQEEADRENQGKEESDKVASAFRFDLLNPFAALFEMFNPGGCVSIPTIASWVHSESSQYCPWFPTSVRSVLTPVFSIISVMILFGFVIRWLGGNDVIRFDKE